MEQDTITAASPLKRAAPASRMSRAMRLVLALVLVTAAVAYSLGVLSGYLAEERQIDGTHFALLVVIAVIVALLVQPRLFDRLKRLKVSGFELEVLEQVREKQAEQAGQLDDIRLLLPLLLPETERIHLFNLAGGRSTGYRGNPSLRSEIRRLRSIGLIRMKDDRQVAQMKDGVVFNLVDFVEMTPLGEQWMERLREMEKS